jgi:hypothetical protein
MILEIIIVSPCFKRLALRTYFMSRKEINSFQEETISALPMASLYNVKKIRPSANNLFKIISPAILAEITN